MGSSRILVDRLDFQLLITRVHSREELGWLRREHSGNWPVTHRSRACRTVELDPAYQRHDGNDGTSEGNEHGSRSDRSHHLQGLSYPRSKSQAKLDLSLTAGLEAVGLEGKGYQTKKSLAPSDNTCRPSVACGAVRLATSTRVDAGQR